MNGRADGHGKQFVAWAGQGLPVPPPTLRFEPLTPGKGPGALLQQRANPPALVPCRRAARPPNRAGAQTGSVTSVSSLVAWCRPSAGAARACLRRGSVEGRVGKQKGGGCGFRYAPPPAGAAHAAPRRGISQRAARWPPPPVAQPLAYRHRSWHPGCPAPAHPSAQPPGVRRPAARRHRQSVARTRKQAMPQIFLNAATWRDTAL